MENRKQNTWLPGKYKREEDFPAAESQTPRRKTGEGGAGLWGTAL